MSTSLASTAFPTIAPAATTSGGANAASSSTSAADSIGGTFLSLLVQELQNQDPTAPMDSTAMVGQMISLNQLNQLTSINQLVTSLAAPASTSGTASGSGTNPASPALVKTQPLDSSAATGTVNTAALLQALQSLQAGALSGTPAGSLAGSLPAAAISPLLIH